MYEKLKKNGAKSIFTIQQGRRDFHSILKYKKEYFTSLKKITDRVNINLKYSIKT